ncbi:F-box/LRR-repeat protein 20 [Balamuthia mandrillaris]
MQPHRNARGQRIKFLLSRDLDTSFDPQEATSQSLLHLLLPEELLHHVFSFLDWPALCRCAFVSHLWRRLSFAVEQWRLQQRAAITSRKRGTYEAEEEGAKKNVPMSTHKAWRDGLDARNRRTHYLMKMLRAEGGEEVADGAKYFSVEGMVIRRPFAFYDYVVRPYFQQQREKWNTKNQRETEEEEQEEGENVNKITRGVMKGWLKELRLPKALDEKLRFAPPKDAFKALSERVIWEEQVEDAREGMLDYHECVEQGLVAAGQQQRKRRRKMRKQDGKQEGQPGEQGMEEQDAQGWIEWMDEMFYCFVQGEDEQWFDYEQVDNDERWDPPEVDLDIGECCPFGCCNWEEM